MATNNTNNSNVTKQFRDNGTHTPVFKKNIPMPPVKPAPTTSNNKSEKK